MTKTKRLPSSIPNKLHFDGMTGTKTYDVIGFQNPKKGDYYLAGATIEAHKAGNDIPTPYWVVKPNDKVTIN